MSEKEKQILDNIAKALPALDDHQKNYLLGLGEGMQNRRRPSAA